MNWLMQYQYQLIRPLGSLNMILGIIALSLFVVRRIQRHFFKQNPPMLKKVTTFLKTLHPLMGGLLIVSAFLHGYLALDGGFRIHTGSIAWFLVVLMMIVALGGKSLKIKYWLKVHRGLAVLLIIAVCVHRIAPNMI